MEIPAPYDRHAGAAQERTGRRYWRLMIDLRAPPSKSPAVWWIRQIRTPSRKTLSMVAKEVSKYDNGLRIKRPLTARLHPSVALPPDIRAPPRNKRSMTAEKEWGGACVRHTCVALSD